MNDTENKKKTSSDEVNLFDVVILGTGVAGAMLGTILARHTALFR